MDTAREPADGTHSSRKRRALHGCSLWGCGLGFSFVLIFIAAYLLAGRYQPKVEPLPTAPRPNGYDEILALASRWDATRLDRTLFARGGRLNETTARRILSQHQALLTQTRTALEHDFLFPYGQWMTVMTHVSAPVSLGRLLIAESALLLRDGHTREAAESALDLVELGMKLQFGVPIASDYAGESLQTMGQRQLLQLADKLTTGESAAMIERLQRLLDRRVSAKEMMQAERRWILTDLASQKRPSMSPSFMDGATAAVEAAKDLRDSITEHLTRDRKLKDFERYLGAMVAEAAKPATTRKPVPAKGVYAEMLAGAYESSIERANAVDLRNRLLLIELAIHRFRRQHSHLPESLSDLSLDSRYTTDPESGRSVVFRREGDDYLLYGLGPDGKDDGGVTADEAAPIVQGDLGIRRFIIPPASMRPKAYLRVPHMRAPKLPRGSPPFID